MPRLSTGATIRLMDTRNEPKRKGRFRASRGDWIVVHPHTLGEHEQAGLILEVLGEPGTERYRVRWDEEHESIFYPGSDATIRRVVSR